MFDSSNGFIDLMNNYLFTLNGLIQNRFDTAVASTWLYWRSASLSANSRGFVTASDNRTELCDCISSFDDVISKVISHLTNDVMKPVFDIKNSNTKIEDDLSKQFDEIKDMIIRSNNINCLKSINYNDYTIGLAYYSYSSFLARSFADITYKTEADYSARFYLDHVTALGYLIRIRSSIMLARSRSDYNNFIRTYCKPTIFAKFEGLIDISNNVVNDCAKRIYNTLNEALDKLPSPVPFTDKLSNCL
ncbi:hypothetical protein ACKWTF_002214 [Chironomus riparius]